MGERKGLRVSILNDQYTNRVAVRSLTLIGEGIDGPSVPNKDAPAVHVVPGNLPGLVKAVLATGIQSPAAFVAIGHAGYDWPMASGAYIDTSDSRFPYDYPVPLHNRYEIDERTALDTGVRFLANRYIPPTTGATT